jgi:VIT1/CCC1 family predicted Fe2+/Mn2+ transporter
MTRWARSLATSRYFRDTQRPADQAALTSAASFSVGAAMPLLAVMAVSVSSLIPDQRQTIRAPSQPIL